MNDANVQTLPHSPELDPRVDLRTAPLAVNAGADVLVAGTAIFADQGGPQAGLLRLIQAIQ